MMEGYPKLITEEWPGISGPINAVMVSDGKRLAFVKTNIKGNNAYQRHGGHQNISGNFSKSKWTGPQYFEFGYESNAAGCGANGYSITE